MKRTIAACIALILALLLCVGCAEPAAYTDSSSVDAVNENPDTTADSSGSDSTENSTIANLDGDAAAVADSGGNTQPDSGNSTQPNNDAAASEDAPDLPDAKEDGDDDGNAATADESISASYDMTEIPVPFVYVTDHGHGLPLFIHIGEELAAAIEAQLAGAPFDLTVGDSACVAQIILDGFTKSISVERTNSEYLILRYKGAAYEMDDDTTQQLMGLIGSATGWNVHTGKLDIKDLSKIELFAGDECVYSTEDADICMAFEALMTGVTPAECSYYSGYTGHIVCTKSDGGRIHIAVNKDDGYLYIAPFGFYKLEAGLMDTAAQEGEEIAINASGLPAALGLEEWPVAMYDRWVDAAQLRHDMIESVTVSEGVIDTITLRSVPAEESYAAPVHSGSGSTTGYTEWALINPKICIYNESERLDYYVTVPEELVSSITEAMSGSTAIDMALLEQLFYIELSGYERFFVCRNADGEIVIVQGGFGVVCPDITTPLIQHLETVTGWQQ